MGLELGKSLEEVAELSVAELEIWISYFKIQADTERAAQNKAKGSRL